MRESASAKRALKISVFCPGSRFFGQERMALAVAKGLKDRGHVVHCVINAWNDGEFASRLRQSGIPFTPVHLGKFSRTVKFPYLWWTINSLVHLPGAQRRCRSHLANFKPDVVLCYDWDWIVFNDPVIEKYRTFLHAQDLAISTASRGSRANKWRFRRLDRRIGTFIAISESVRRRLLALGVAENKIRLVYNGIEPAKSTSSRVDSDERVRIGIVGQVGKWKGHDDLIEALRILRDHREIFECVIIGTGNQEYIRALRAKISEHGLSENVRWLGYMRNTDEIFAQLDICAVPSHWEETFGLTAAEAGLREIPVVAARSGALPEVVLDGETGFVVDTGSPEQLANRLRCLIKEPQLRRSLGAAARQRILSRFSEDRMISGMEQLFRHSADEIPFTDELRPGAIPARGESRATPS